MATGAPLLMQPDLRRRRVLRAAAALSAASFLPRAQACEYFASTLRIVHPWTRASGTNTSAAVLCTFDQVSESERLIGVETPVAGGAELIAANGELIAGRAGQSLSLLIPAGRDTILSEDAVHIRLVGLTQPLLIARSYPLTFVFERAGTVNATLNVDFLRARLPFAAAHRP